MCRKNFENRLTNNTLMTKKILTRDFVMVKMVTRDSLFLGKNEVYNIVFKIPRHTYLGYKLLNKISIWKVGQGVPQ